MDKREAFLFYRSFHEATKKLNDDLYKEIMVAVLEYALDGNLIELSPMAECAFLLIKAQIDANNRKREAGKKGGETRAENEAKRAEAEAKVKQTEAEVKQTQADLNQSQAEVKQTQADLEESQAKDKGIKNKDKSKSISDPLITSTGEPLPAPPEADCEAIPLNDGTEWKPTQELFAEWERLYPGVDVRQKIRDMRGWCLSNPTRRKTRRGVQAFVTGWLSREQNKAPAQPQAKRKTRFDNFPGHDTDYDALMWGMVAGGKQ